MPVKASFQLYGDSGDGKTYLIGEFGKHVFKTSGGKVDPKTRLAVGGKITRVYSADCGGWTTIQPLVDLGIVQVVPLLTLPNPFSWLHKISQGMVPDPKDPTGKRWVKDVANIGVFAFEGETAFSDLLMKAMADKAAQGINIGGDGAFNFTDGDLVVGSNNRGHYMQAQSALSRAIANSQWLLPSDAYVIWSAMARKGEDEKDAQVLGPQAAGKALTGDLPRWFVYTFRLSTIPQDNGTVEHRLYLDDHKDKELRGAKGLGNSRMPVGSTTKLPSFISPASLVEAYRLVQSGYENAVNNLVEELK